MRDPTSILRALDELLDRGRGVRATIRPAEGALFSAGGGPLRSPPPDSEAAPRSGVLAPAGRAADAAEPQAARAAPAPLPPGTRTAGVPVDDWSSQRSIVYDQAMANRWKADCLRLLREAFGAEGAPYREFGAAVERAGVLWRAIDPGLELLTRLRDGTARESRA